jgi:ABC-type glycerol-3-phosphate transport system substrate-binding protein
VSEVIDSVYAGFTEQNPNVTIRRETIQNEQLRQTVRTALASGPGRTSSSTMPGRATWAFSPTPG